LNTLQLLNEARHDNAKLREANHLMELQVEGYCKRIIELKARYAKLRENLNELLFVIEEERITNDNAWTFQQKEIYDKIEGKARKALLLVEEEAKK
jgi:hypothetical protein